MRLVFIFYLIIFICLFFIFNCCQYSGGQQNIDSSDVIDNLLIESYNIIEVSNLSFTIEWDSPSGSAPNSYRIYYKEHLTSLWILLDEIPSSQLEYVINYNNLNGEELYDFGVSALYLGEESLLHYSLDNEAEPSTGWYIKFVL